MNKIVNMTPMQRFMLRVAAEAWPRTVVMSDVEKRLIAKGVYTPRSHIVRTLRRLIAFGLLRGWPHQGHGSWKYLATSAGRYEATLTCEEAMLGERSPLTALARGISIARPSDSAP